MSTSTPALKVHHLQVSQSERIVFLCEELAIPYDLVLHQRSPLLSPQSIKDLNPLGQAPIIQDTLNGRAITLAESGACLEYINTVHGSNRLSLPPSHPNYTDYLYWFHFGNSNLQATIGRMMALKWSGVDLSSGYAKSVIDRVDLALKVIDDRVKGNTWLAGEDFTMADVMIVFSLTTMRTFAPYSLKGYNGILSYLKRISEREGYRRTRERGDPELALMIDAEAPEGFADGLKRQGKM